MEAGYQVFHIALVANRRAALIFPETRLSQYPYIRNRLDLRAPYRLQRWSYILKLAAFQGVDDLLNIGGVDGERGRAGSWDACEYMGEISVRREICYVIISWGQFCYST